MRLLFAFGLLPMMLSFAVRDSENCQWYNNNTIANKFALLVSFPADEEYCSMKFVNPWSMNMQNGFAIFPRQPIDCSLNVTVKCLPEGSGQTPLSLPSVQYTCRTSSEKVELPCELIELTFARNNTIPPVTRYSNVQVVALAKAPCVDEEILFQCPRDYPNSCLDRKLRCNGRSECPSGDDELNCQKQPSGGISMLGIIVGVLSLLSILCVTCTVLVCFCCRATCRALLDRFRSARKNQIIEKGEFGFVHGEDAGLIRGLAASNVIGALPAQAHIEPTTLVIDSTKPVYPHV